MNLYMFYQPTHKSKVMCEQEFILKELFNPDWHCFIPNELLSIQQRFPHFQNIRDIYDECAFEYGYSIEYFRDNAPFMVNLQQNGDNKSVEAIYHYLMNTQLKISKPFSSKSKLNIRIKDNITILTNYKTEITQNLSMLTSTSLPLLFDVYIIPTAYQIRSSQKNNKTRRTRILINERLNMDSIRNSKSLISRSGINDLMSMFRDFKTRMENECDNAQRAVLIIKRANEHHTYRDTLHLFVPEHNTLPILGGSTDYSELTWINLSKKCGVIQSDDKGILHWSWHFHTSGATKSYQYFGDYGSRVFKHNSIKMLKLVFPGNCQSIDENTLTNFNHYYQSFTDNKYDKLREHFAIMHNLYLTETKEKSTVISKENTLLPLTVLTQQLQIDRKKIENGVFNNCNANYYISYLLIQQNALDCLADMTMHVSQLILKEYNNNCITNNVLQWNNYGLISDNMSIPTFNNYLPPNSQQFLAPNYIEKWELGHGGRAKCNIYVEDFQTQYLNEMLAEHEKEKYQNSTSDLYYTFNHKTAQQFCEEKLLKYSYNNGDVIGIVNTGIDAKMNNGKIFGVCVPNINKTKNNESNDFDTKNKWQWMLQAFMTANEIESQYCIYNNQLPHNSYVSERDCYIELFREDIENIDFEKLNLLPNYKKKKSKWEEDNNDDNKVDWELIDIKITKKELIGKCMDAIKQYNRFIPNLLIEKKVRIYNLLIISLPCSDIDSNVLIGISFRKNLNRIRNYGQQKWQAKSICLDAGDICNKFRLLGIRVDKYDTIFYQLMEQKKIFQEKMQKIKTLTVV